MRNLSLVIAGFFQAHVKPEGFFFKEMGGEFSRKCLPHETGNLTSMLMGRNTGKVTLDRTSISTLQQGFTAPIVNPNWHGGSLVLAILQNRLLFIINS